MKTGLLRLDFTISWISFRGDPIISFQWKFDNWKILLWVELRLYVFSMCFLSIATVRIHTKREEINNFYRRHSFREWRWVIEIVFFVLFIFQSKDILNITWDCAKTANRVRDQYFFLGNAFFQFIQFITCLNFGMG